MFHPPWRSATTCNALPFPWTTHSRSNSTQLSQRPKTVIAVNDTRNLARVQLVSPDMVIAPTILGSELLAMAMTNEQLDGTDLVGKLFPARGKAS